MFPSFPAVYSLSAASCTYLRSSLGPSLPPSFPHAFLLDMDECADGLANCEQMCDNRMGTFICSCAIGYTLDSNDENCTGK